MACCACVVIESHSSKIMILKIESTFFLLKSLIVVLIVSIPRSSEAFNSKMASFS
ncbi:hypothetical protein NBO_364g0005 [Nosema bombycis CQ1]|uniref:Uncharacterized protein n=1 Tax=Nosema bombycis (strain CQ1 / CVCC 102059) TaxID=578461 RepID=R0M465_NOSB1|nr:hypothetical protein NBO_364g0005 [Nosema bombycis CQ1]|eukprot:EOB12799.1 hypothetical protein NBO_364g0005 [Nosema bombycis CQ1]